MKCHYEFPVDEAVFCETCGSKIICPKCGTCNCIACGIEDEHHRCTCIEERIILATIEEGGAK